ncbi:MAG TPA: hypothetical protein VFY13_07230 [Luteolibacter sp.]|nr:hypothetical protein [Luteolibacter sp.]
MISCAWLMLALFGLAGEVREWTNQEGRKIRAALVECVDGNAVLKMEQGGRDYKVPLASLSKADVDYVQEWMRNKPTPGTDKGKEPGKSPAATAADNWNAEWPTLISGDVSPEIEVVEEDDAQKRYVYRSPHYEFVCDVKLSQNVVNRFSILFEATNLYARSLPLALAKAHQAQRHTILLFETFESYVRNGGPPGSAGVYMSGKDVIMVPLTSLGVIKGAGGYRVDYDKGNKTLPHEITHQLTDMPYFAPGAMGWFSEGLAEYVATTPYRSGKFVVRGNQSAVEAYVTAYGEKGDGGRALGKKIRVPDLRGFMLQSYESFVANGNTNYGIGLLLVYYFCHWDGDQKGGNLKAFLQALKQGKRGEEALQVLLAGRSFDELEVQIAKAWSGRGVTLEFQ